MRRPIVLRPYDSDDEDFVSRSPLDRRVPDLKQNGTNAKVLRVVIMLLAMVLLIVVVCPQIAWYAAFLKGFFSELWKVYGKQAKKVAKDHSWLAFYFGLTKPLTIPCVILHYFGKTKANESSLFPLVMTLPLFNADISTTVLYILCTNAIVKYHNCIPVHCLIGFSMMDNTLQMKGIFIFQAAVSYWYVTKSNDKSWVDEYTKQIVLFLEKMSSTALQKMGRFSTQDVFGYLQDQMGFGASELVYDDKTKELGYRRRGRSQAQGSDSRDKAPRPGPRGRSPGRFK